jgi:hypothetical protein
VGSIPVRRPRPARADRWYALTERSPAIAEAITTPTAVSQADDDQPKEANASAAAVSGVP